MEINRLSERQRAIYDFALSEDYALICHGAVRSGKTSHMTLAFLLWAMERFDRTCFAICGKTVSSVQRNILDPLLAHCPLPYTLDFALSRHTLTVTCGQRVNTIYLFGGRDEGSYALIQGVTLAGVLFDEAALMPRSFVDQAMARCISTPGAKYWFNCNPEGPGHWFYRQWLEAPKPGVTVLHFTLADNPVLTPAMIRRTESLYHGAFYDRYILGKWVKAEGLVYPMFGEACLAGAEERVYTRYVISMDYGIQNPTAMLLWGCCDGVWYLTEEFYHSGRDSGEQRTDQEYYEALCALAGDRDVEHLIIDPSAASFIALVRREKRFRVRKARNDVLPGIQTVAAALSGGQIKICRGCENTIREFGQYVWDGDAEGDRPKKEHDHAMDAVRYFVMTVGKQRRQYRPLWN